MIRPVKSGVLTAEAKAYVRLLQNPYASLSLEESSEEVEPISVSLEQKRAYFRQLQNPHAHDSIFGDPDSTINSPGNITQSTQPAAATEFLPAPTGSVDLAAELDDLLRLYKPHVARNDWSRVADYRATFLERARNINMDVTRLVTRIRSLKFNLMPGEKVEYNRAPAQRIISELDRLLA